MKMNVFFALCVCVLFAACEKREPQVSGRVSSPGGSLDVPTECTGEIIAREPVKVGETDLWLPIGTKICPDVDAVTVRVELPPGYSFATREPDGTARPLPMPYATYACYCSQVGSACKVFYAEGLGFGCLQSNCTGSCTGKFTYKGYTVDRVVYTDSRIEFFNRPEIQREIVARYVESDDVRTPGSAYIEAELYGISFFAIVRPKKLKEEAGLSEPELLKARCDCEGTKACTLKTVTLPALKENDKIQIYFCEGSCNGCELTVE